MTFLLAHLSDAHLGPVPRPRKRDLLNKRLTGYFNWMGERQRIHDMDVMAALIEDMRAQSPDHIAMTGDVMNIGLPQEFVTARAFLQGLGAPADVSFVPGNHDAYVRGSMPQIVETFAPWSANDGAHHTSYPYLRRRGDVALIGVSSGVPTLPFVASGRLGLEQREKLSALLEETGREGLMRVVMIHHPPYRKGATPGRGLTDARQLEKIVEEYGAELLIHGHNHRFSLHKMKSSLQSSLAVGVASASAVPGSPRHRAAYNLYRIEKSENGWRIEGRVRGLLPNSREIGDIESFEV